eukprot:3153283-Prymnesium_polylepis.1
MPQVQCKGESSVSHSIGAMEWVRVRVSTHPLQAKSEEVPQVQGKERKVSQSIQWGHGRRSEKVWIAGISTFG